MDFKQTTSVITGGCKKALGLIADHIKASTKLKQQQQLQIQQQQLQHLCETVRSEIRDELSCIFVGKKYPLINLIETAGSIIPLPYINTLQGTLFQFRLPAQDHSTPKYFYQQIKEHMQADIQEYQQTIAGTDPVTFNLAMYIHPYIMRGLYVMDVRKDGAYIKITVASNYFPEL